MKTLVADIETDHLLSEMTTVHCVSVMDHQTKDISSYSSTSIPEGIERINAADRVVFHNGIAFDARALSKCGYTIDPTKIYDTLVASRLDNPQREGGHSLRAWGDRLGFEKGEVENFETLTPEMIQYCERDVRLTAKLYDSLFKRVDGPALELEHQVAVILAQQEANGFGFDVKEAEALLVDLYGERKAAEDALKEIFQPIFVDGGEFTPKKDNARLGYEEGQTFHKIKRQEFNPGSRQQIAQRLIKKYGWKPKAFTPGGQPEISETVLATLDYPEAKAMHRYLRVEKMISMVAGDKGWLKLQRNGRIHGEVNTLGARTGRMTHRNPNVAQADRDPRMRKLFIPREGWKLVGVDADGLEARLLGHYLAPLDGGEFSERVVNGDFHTFNQELCGLEQRNSAKTLFYAFMYGAGDGRIGDVVYNDRPFKGSKTKAGKATRKKLADGIAGLNKLVTHVRQTAADRGYLKGLDGRKLYTPSAHSALNTLIQGAGAVLMKKALVLFDHDTEFDQWAYVANVHDEVQFEAHPDVAEWVAEQMIVSIRQAGIDLKLRCAMDGSSAIGNNWSETH